MKRRYRIDREKALRRFQKHAEEGPAEVQLHLPLKEAATALQEGADRLMRQAGLERRQLVLREEVRPLAGARCARRQDEQAYRWDREKGSISAISVVLRSDLCRFSRRPRQPSVPSAGALDWQGRRPPLCQSTSRVLR